MKKIFNKILVFFNILFSLLLCLCFISPYIYFSSLYYIAIISIFFNILLFINILFFFYWLIKLSNNTFLSVFPLILCLYNINGYYKIKGNNIITEENKTNNIKLMSFNINKYIFRKHDKNKESLLKIIKTNNPKILCLQEYIADINKLYKYKFIKKKVKNYGVSILSDYPIINSGELKIESNFNNIIFCDLQIKDEIIRVYNIHLESFNIRKNPEKDINFLSYLYNNIKIGVIKHQKQVNILQSHIKKCKYKTIICGDLNNNFLSYEYRIIKTGMKDCFVEAGKGFGNTFDLSFYPLRIDYIFVDDNFKVKSFKVIDINISDHFPIISEFSIEK